MQNAKERVKLATGKKFKQKGKQETMLSPAVIDTLKLYFDLARNVCNLVFQYIHLNSDINFLNE